MAKWTVKQNTCNCHPETCCCNDWALYNPEGNKHSTYFAEKTATEIAAALNKTLEPQTSADSVEEFKTQLTRYLVSAIDLSSKPEVVGFAKMLIELIERGEFDSEGKSNGD